MPDGGERLQKVLAAVGQFTLLNQVQKVDVPIGVAGLGEGGLLAFYAAAVDPRIKGALVSGSNPSGHWANPPRPASD